MKHTSNVWRLLAAAAVATCTLAPGPSLALSPALVAASDADKKPQPEAPADEEYRLRPGDKLRIEVYKDPQLSQAAQIRPDGKITLPLVGDLEANGRTPIELRETIARALKEYVNSPVVTVIVVEATAVTAYVVGEVYHPGAVVLQGHLTVLQALALAGGLKDFADQKNIRVLRPSPTGVRPITFNYKSAVKGEGVPVYLRPGDTVVVPD